MPLEIIMQQPELGRRLTALRKERNLTQEELVEKSNVSVRTIQRIEAGEVMPRMSTVKILLAALGEKYESFSTKSAQVMETKASNSQQVNRNTLLVAAIDGAVYLVLQIILSAMDVAWLTSEDKWAFEINAVYASLTIVMVVSFTLFVRGFIVLSNIFENGLLKIASYMLIVATVGLAVLDISSLSVENVETLWPAYGAAAVLFGTLGIVFGVSLIRLQDSMGELSRIAGILEILMGCLLVTVVLFFLAYVIMIPAVVVEILVLYRGYEYLSRSASVQVVGV